MTSGVNGICFFAPTGPHGSSLGSHLKTNVRRSDVEGSPATPSLEIAQPNQYWRFRWAVLSGTHTISVRVKQVANGTPRPSIVIKANPAIGVNSDVTEVAPSGADWVTIGPATVSPTSDGVLWVELWNNYAGNYNPSSGDSLPWAPAFFDHVVTTST